jgi:TRAP-type C4-dicarboxylate transport system permease small subunit
MVERGNVWTVILAAGCTLIALLAFSTLYVRPNSASAVALQLSLVFLAVPVIGSLIIIYVGWRPFESDEDDEESVFD